MSKEESIFIGEPMSDEEFEAYMERMDDPNDLSDERWFHIFCEWLNHCMDINWDGSYYDSILIQKKAGHESEIKSFIDRRIVEGRNLTHEMKTWVVATKENHKDLFLEPEDEKEENVKQRFSKEDYYAFLEKKESDGFTPGKYSETERLISIGSSIRVHKKNWIKKRGFDDNIPQIFEVLKADGRISENEITSILNPPSKYYLQAQINRIMHHANHPDGDYFKENIRLIEKIDTEKNKIFLIEPK